MEVEEVADKSQASQWMKLTASQKLELLQYGVPKLQAFNR